MEENNVIEADYFPFSNPLDKEVTLKWGGIEYTFPAMSTTKLLGKIPDATPEQVQNIRKKFAKDLAVIAYYDTDGFKKREGQTPPNQGFEMRSAATYTDADLAPFIQKCLTPLPIAVPKMEKVDSVSTEKKLRTDEKGKRVSRVLQGGEDLVKEAQNADL